MDKGRIVIGWLPGAFNISIEVMIAQMAHLIVDPVRFGQWFYCTFVYGSNERHERRKLWDSLGKVCTDQPWVILGDFNVVLNIDERIVLDLLLDWLRLVTLESV